MADTKTVTATIALAVPCPDKSTRDGKGRYTEVVLRHEKPGAEVTIATDEADALIARGVATEVAVEVAPPAKPKKTADA